MNADPGPASATPVGSRSRQACHYSMDITAPKRRKGRWSIRWKERWARHVKAVQASLPTWSYESTHWVKLSYALQ